MDSLAGLAFELDRGSDKPLFEQICARIRVRIVDGRITAGTRLPATRGLAADLGVSRSTVVTAYEQLVAEGYMRSRQGSGFVVCDLGEVEFPTSLRRPKVLAEDAKTDELSPFQAGRPDMRLFPYRQWAKALARVCRSAPEKMLIGAGPAGNATLRQMIATHLAEWRGIEAHPDQVIITAGAADGLELCLRTLVARGDLVGLEDPGYPPLRALVDLHGAGVVPLKVDGEGALPPGKEVPRLAVLTPSQQFPLGGAMSAQRRMDFIRWAHDAHAWLVEDDYDSEFRYAGRPIPALSGIDGLRRTVYVGSFSKIFSNSLRLGYVVVPTGLRAEMLATLSRTGVKASLIPQQALAGFMESGEFFRHLRRVRRIYAERRDFLTSCLRRDFADFGQFSDHQAGMQVVFHLRQDLSDRKVRDICAARGVTVQPLSAYYTTDRANRGNGLVLGFCAHNPDEMRCALEVLRAALSNSQSVPPYT